MPETSTRNAQYLTGFQGEASCMRTGEYLRNPSATTFRTGSPHALLPASRECCTQSTATFHYKASSMYASQHWPNIRPGYHKTGELAHATLHQLFAIFIRQPGLQADERRYTSDQNRHHHFTPHRMLILATAQPDSLSPIRDPPGLIMRHAGAKLSRGH